MKLPTEQTTTPRPTFVGLFIVFVLAIAPHLFGVNGVFVFDDIPNIQKNQNLGPFWDLKWFRITDRPLTNLTLAANFAVGAKNPFGYHLVNIGLHGITAMVLFCLIYRTLTLPAVRWSDPNANHVALGSSVLWAVHPLTTAVVTYTIQRSELLMTLFLFATLLLWNSLCRGSSRYRFAKAVLFCVSACACYLSKQNSVVLPFVLVIYDWAFSIGGFRASKLNRISFAVICVPVFVGVYLLLPGIMRSGPRTVGFRIEGINWTDYVLTQPLIFLRYLRLAFWPVGQSIDYGWLPVETVFSRICGGVLWFLIGLTLVVCFRKSKAAFFLIAASLLVLAPTTFVPTQDVIFEHRFYSPLACLIVGFLAAAAKVAGIMDGSERVGRLLRFGSSLGVYKAATVFGWVLVLVLSSLTVFRNIEFSSEGRFAATELARNPENPRNWYNAAGRLELGNLDRNIEMTERAITLSHERGFFYLGTEHGYCKQAGDLRLAIHEYDRAAGHYRRAYEATENEAEQAEILRCMGLLAMSSGNISMADGCFEKALKLEDADVAKIVEDYVYHLRKTDRHVKADEVEQGLSSPVAMSTNETQQ